VDYITFYINFEILLLKCYYCVRACVRAWVLYRDAPEAQRHVRN